jgi:hypothetical protein
LDRYLKITDAISYTLTTSTGALQSFAGGL